MTTALLSVFFAVLLIVSSLSSSGGEIQTKINKKYLNNIEVKNLELFGIASIWD